MYAQHVPLIRAHGFKSPEGLVDVITFVLLTIRVPFVRVAPTVKEVRVRGEKADALWGWKIDGWRYARENAEGLHAELSECEDPVAAISILCQVPGLGIVKSAFVAQLLGFSTGCLDSRNMAEFGIPANAFKVNGHPKTERITNYCREVNRLGGAEYLWDNWCSGVATQYKLTGERISAMHVEMICGKAALRKKG